MANICGDFEKANILPGNQMMPVTRLDDKVNNCSSVGPSKVINYSLKKSFKSLQVVEKMVDDFKNESLAEAQDEHLKQHYEDFYESMKAYFGEVNRNRSDSKIDIFLKRCSLIHSQVVFLSNTFERAHYPLTACHINVISTYSQAIQDLQWARNFERITGSSESVLVELAKALCSVQRNLDVLIAVVHSMMGVFKNGFSIPN